LYRTQLSTPLNIDNLQAVNLKQGFSPAIAVFGYRAPLAPRLARLAIILADKN